MAACPLCKDRETVAEFRPFCSQRCADIDLGRWFTGRYAIPGRPAAADGHDDDED